MIEPMVRAREIGSGLELRLVIGLWLGLKLELGSFYLGPTNPSDTTGHPSGT